MRFSLVFKVKGAMRWMFTEDSEAVMLVVAMLSLYKIPYALYDRRTVILTEGSP